MAEGVSPGAQQKAQQLNLARNRRRPEGRSGSVAGKLGASAAAPQYALVEKLASKIPGGAKVLKLDKKWMRMVWRVLLWSLPLSAPLIAMLLLLLVLMLLL